MGFKIIKISFDGDDLFDVFKLKNIRYSGTYQSSLFGFFDMAKRDGVTYHDWGTEVTPILVPSLVEYKKKDVTLNFITNSIEETLAAFDNSSINDANSNLIIREIEPEGTYDETLFSGPFILEKGPVFTKLEGTNYYKGSMDIKINDPVAPVNFTFDSNYSGVRIESNGSVVPLAPSCGFYPTSLSGVNSYGDRIVISGVDIPSTPGCKFPKITLKGLVIGSSFSDFESKLRNLRALFRGFDDNPLTYYPASGQAFNFFVDTGFSIRRVYSDFRTQVIGELTMVLNKI